MKFKDAYEKYKKNEASEEERAFVEEQIEQFQALMDVCIEDEKEEILEEEILPSESMMQDNFDMDLYRKVKKALKWSRIRYLLIFVLVLCLLPVSFHLWKGLTVYHFTDKEGNYTVYSNMHVLYSELDDPEFVRSDTFVQKAGFGKYSLSSSETPTLQTGNHRSASNGIEYAFVDSFYKRTFLGVGAVYERNGVENFMRKGGSYPYHSMTENQAVLDAEAIASMPKNTMFSIYLKMDKELTLEEILSIDKEYKTAGVDMGLRWMPIYYGSYDDPNYAHQSRIQYLGFDFYYDGARTGEIDYDKEKYPYLQIATEQYDEFGNKLFDEVTEEMYRTHVDSVLNYIFDHEDFNETFRNNLDDETKAKEIIKAQGIKSDIVYLNISRDDLLEVLQNEHVISGCITDTLQVF